MDNFSVIRLDRTLFFLKLKLIPNKVVVFNSEFIYSRVSVISVIMVHQVSLADDASETSG